MKLLNKIRESEFLSKKRNRIICLIAFIIIIIVPICIYLAKKGIVNELFAPSIILSSPKPIEASNRDEILVDVKLSSLPKNLYPAASISVIFDQNKLEFLGVKQGTMMTLGKANSGQAAYSIPIWKSDIAVSNVNGQINTMYLDITGGTYAYTHEGFNKTKKNILLRLAFRLRDSTQSGDIYNLTIKDAVIATADNEKNRTSLATSNRTLKAYHAKIIVK